MKSKIIIIIVHFSLLLTGCRSVEKVIPTPTIITPTLNTSTPTSTPTPTPISTHTPTSTFTPFPTYTTTPTHTPLPTNTPTATPHPLAGISHQVVFVSDDDGDADIYIVNADGSDLRNLSNNDIPDSFPAVSFDGQRIAMASITEDNPNIFLMDIDGSNLTQITNDEGSNLMPAWSPDGERLAFVSDRDGDFEIFVTNLYGTDLVQVTKNNTTDVFPAWSPDGKWIAFSSSISGNPDIYLIRPDGTDLRQVTRSSNYDGDVATWSFDGKWLIFTSQRIGNKEIYAVSLDSEQFGALTQTEKDEVAGYISPDGQYLLRETQAGDLNRIEINLVTDVDTIYTFLPEQMQVWFPSWVPNPEVEIVEPQFTFISPPEAFCIYETDATFGHTLDNPNALGTAPIFGGPFNSAYADAMVRGPNGETVIFEDYSGSSAPSAVNENGDIVALFSYEIKGIRSGILYLNTGDHSIPRIPTGFTCDLEWP